MGDGIEVGVNVGIIVGTATDATGAIIAILALFEEFQGNRTTNLTLVLANVDSGRSIEISEIPITNPNARKNFSLPDILPR